MSFADQFADRLLAKHAPPPMEPPQYNPSESKRKLVIKMDSRETVNDWLVRELRAQLEAAGLGDRLIIESLDLFDFVYVFADDHKKPFGPGIERKKVTDVASSVFDGRWKNQATRMREGKQPADKIIYIVEGDPLNTPRGFNKWSMHGAMLKPAMNAEHSTAITATHKHTCALLVWWLMYLERIDDPALTKHYSYADGVETQVNKTEFRDGNRLALQIAGFVAGASPMIATAITKKYPTMAELQGAFLKDSAGTHKAIAEMEVEGRDKRIGPALAKKLYDVFEIDKLRAILDTPGLRPMHGGVSPAKPPKPSPRRTFKSEPKRLKLDKCSEDIDDDDDDE